MLNISCPPISVWPFFLFEKTLVDADLTWGPAEVVACVLIKPWFLQKTSHSNRDVAKQFCVLTDFSGQSIQKIPNSALQSCKGSPMSP